MPFHLVKIDGSKPLQRIVAYLGDRGELGATGLEVATQCRVLNVATWVSHLRRQGIPIETVFDRTTEEGARVYRYFFRGPI